MKKFTKYIEEKNVFLILGATSQGIDCYYYVKVHPHNTRKIMNITEGAKVNISELGEVIEKGYGEPPVSL